MALGKGKIDGTTNSNRWDLRAVIKRASKKQRREERKKEARNSQQNKEG